MGLVLGSGLFERHLGIQELEGFDAELRPFGLGQDVKVLRGTGFGGFDAVMIDFEATAAHHGAESLDLAGKGIVTEFVPCDGIRNRGDMEANHLWSYKDYGFRYP